MKRMIMAIVAMLTMTVSATAMSYEQARREALFLTDKMAYELNLTDEQYDAAYEINLDYLMGVTGRDDVFGTYWTRRNLDISYILLDWQWNAFRAATYFYRPLYWHGGYWRFGIYARYPRRDYFYFGRPTVYISYRGGHSWHHNGGHSYYHGRKNDFHRGHGHTGMRDRWDKGDYHKDNRPGKNSSTHVTAKRGDNNGTATPGSATTGRTQGFGGSRTTGTVKNDKPTNTVIQKRTTGFDRGNRRTTVSDKRPGFTVGKGTEIRKKETLGTQREAVRRNTGSMSNSTSTIRRSTEPASMKTATMSRSSASTINRSASSMSRHSSVGTSGRSNARSGSSHSGSAKGRFGGSR
ncbi:MAG: hypothetical protein J6B91_03300 [Prevotella sp.]|nr:hypothetical protein [Prevotella sp.]